MYDVDRERSPWVKILLVILGIILIIFIVLFLIKACGNGQNNENANLEDTLLKAGKDYYNEEGLPSAVGECETISLGKLVDLDFIKNDEAFTTCDNDDTYVKVCKLESGKYQYTPLLSCTEERTVFGEWQEGSETDLVVDKSDVTFTYKAERMTKTTTTTTEQTAGTRKSYYPGNGSDASKVKELYVSSPASGYIYRDSSASASKWYTEKTKGGTLWNNGAYSATAPSGFPNKLNEKTVASGVSATQPAAKDGRTITAQTLYRLGETAVAYRYKCSSPTSAGYVYSWVVCENRTSTDDYKSTVEVFYGCRTGSAAGDSTYDVASTGTGTPAEQNAANAKAAATSCPWIENSCTSSVKCKSTNGYKYVDKEWQWSTEATVVRSYYPSGSQTSAGENTYFISAPVTNAIRDKATTTTAFKYYKLVNTTTNKEVPGEEVEEWVAVNEDFVTKEELIETLKSLNYEVETLKDVEDNAELRYTVKLEYRSREN